MATVIDALIVTLGLDPSDFTKGQKEAASAFTKTGESATKVGKSIETSGKGAAEAISKIRDQAIELFAVFLGGKGLKEFIGDITAANTAVGRLGETLGVSSHFIDAMGKAVEAAGGSYDSAVKSISYINQQFAELSVTGKAAIVAYLRPLQAATGVDLTSKGKTQLQYWEALAAALQKIKATQGSAVATQFAHNLGIDDPGLVALLERGPKAYDALYKAAEKYAATKADFKAAEDRTKSFSLLDDALVKLGRDILTKFSPAIDAAADAIRHFIDTHPEAATAILSGLGLAVIGLGTAFTVNLTASMFSGIASGFSLIGTAATSAAAGVSALTAAIAAIGIPAAAVIALGKLTGDFGEDRIEQAKKKLAAGGYGPLKDTKDMSWSEWWKAVTGGAPSSGPESSAQPSKSSGDAAARAQAMGDLGSRLSGGQVGLEGLSAGAAADYEKRLGKSESGNVYDKGNRLALQLPFLKVSESMGDHDSAIVGAGSVD